MDLTKFKNIECHKENSKKKILKYSKSPYINENTTKIGYPLTNKNPIYLKDYYQNYRVARGPFFRLVMNNLIDIDNKDLMKNNYNNEMPEIILDYTNDSNGERKININFNKTLSKMRKQDEKKVIPYSNNIIIFFIDSVSRNNALRKLKKTMTFFEKFMSYNGGWNPKFPSVKYHSFQFFKYNAFKGHTINNYPKLFYGSNVIRKMTRITKYFKENGYITCFSNSECYNENIRTRHNLSKEEICDYEMINCDPNTMDITSYTKRCLYDKLIIDYQLEYGNQFWRTYSKNRKFLFFVNNDGHEPTLEALKYSDENLFLFFNNLFNDNLLEDTSIILLSDHGLSVPSIYYFLDFFQKEAFLPMLFIFE